jgi:hypothetical protein
MIAEEPMMVTYGPLTEYYKFTKLLFHWGANDSAGSETVIDGKR